jgi:hypothetical protein
MRPTFRWYLWGLIGADWLESAVDWDAYVSDASDIIRGGRHGPEHG